MLSILPEEFKEDLVDYNKSDWAMVVTILQEIAGDPPDDDQRPDPEVITEAISQRNSHEQRVEEWSRNFLEMREQAETPKI